MKRTSKDKVGQHGEEQQGADDNRAGYLIYNTIGKEKVVPQVFPTVSKRQ
jgi:hypothetical protein